MPVENETQDVVREIQQHFKNNWRAAEYGPLIFENTEEEPPRGKPYTHCNIILGDQNQISLGNNPLERALHQVAVQIYTLWGTGLQPMTIRSDAAKAIFRRASIRVEQYGLIRFRKPGTLRIVGRVDEVLYQGSIFFPFDWDIYT